jgi:hypothetical protein
MISGQANAGFSVPVSGLVDNHSLRHIDLAA